MPAVAHRRFFDCVLIVTAGLAGAAASPATQSSAPSTAATSPATRAATSPTTRPLTLVALTMDNRNTLVSGSDAIFSFRRDGPAEKDLPVSFLPDGDGVEGVDFEPMPPHVIISKGFAMTSLHVRTLRNPNRAGGRTIGVKLMPPPEHDLAAWKLQRAPATAPASATPSATHPTTRD